ncbi:hypothetical protein P7C71_g6604, partial [Lecanoromycetidae sp. Uapishka_2]
MHPGVIASGLSSIFKPAPNIPGQKTTELLGENEEVRATPADVGEDIQSSASSSCFPSSSTTLMPMETISTSTLPMSPAMSVDLPVKDPNYDPPFVNDVRLPQRTGWANALHFLNKHSDGLRAATTSYVKSHLEFGGAMADYKGLKNRYEKLRALEDVDPKQQTRVRFVNYYTASTGRPKKPKSAATSGQVTRVNTNQTDGEASGAEEDREELDPKVHDVDSPSLSPRISIEKPNCTTVASYEDKQRLDGDLLGADQSFPDDESATSDASLAMDHVEPAPMTDDEFHEAHEDNEEASALHPAELETPTSSADHSKSASISSSKPK